VATMRCVGTAASRLTL